MTPAASERLFGCVQELDIAGADQVQSWLGTTEAVSAGDGDPIFDQTRPAGLGLGASQSHHSKVCGRLHNRRSYLFCTHITH